jgi:hypothetical protein
VGPVTAPAAGRAIRLRDVLPRGESIGIDDVHVGGLARVPSNRDGQLRHMFVGKVVSSEERKRPHDRLTDSDAERLPGDLYLRCLKSVTYVHLPRDLVDERSLIRRQRVVLVKQGGSLNVRVRVQMGARKRRKATKDGSRNTDACVPASGSSTRTNRLRSPF